VTADPQDQVAAMTDHDVIVAELAGLLASPLDPVLSDTTRLRIQAALHALPGTAAMSFTILRKALMLTATSASTSMCSWTPASSMPKSTGAASGAPRSTGPPARDGPPSMRTSGP
jgi:hypothetical protein